VQGEFVVARLWITSIRQSVFSWKLYDDLRISRVVAIRNV
jgi:hypothetical protein